MVRWNMVIDLGGGPGYILTDTFYIIYTYHMGMFIQEIWI